MTILNRTILCGNSFISYYGNKISNSPEYIIANDPENFVKPQPSKTLFYLYFLLCLSCSEDGFDGYFSEDVPQIKK